MSRMSVLPCQLNRSTQHRRYVRVKYAAGLKINAGTINPHLPKRAIAWTEIDRWVNEAHEQETSCEKPATEPPLRNP
jgi:hypothetical protein